MQHPSPQNLPYHTLEQHFTKIVGLENIVSIMVWDKETMMPKKSLETRSKELAILEKVIHGFVTDPSIEDLLAAAEDQVDTLSDWQRSNLSEMGHAYRHACAIPEDLVEKATTAEIKAQSTWAEAKQNNDFSLLKPALEGVLKLKQEEAAYLSSVLQLSPYNALLDGYERGLTSQLIDPLFVKLKDFLPGFLHQVLQFQEDWKENTLPLQGPFSEEVQSQFVKQISERIGFDFGYGRMDTSTHPFCAGTPEDTRFTTWYKEDNLLAAFFAVAHETGHALYEQGLPKEWQYQPVGKARGMMMHESQSVLIERQACRCTEFISYFADLVQQTFNVQNIPWATQKNLQKHIYRVEPGYIRVYADAVTYPLHIILRYKLEKDMITNVLEVKDLPEAWNQGMKELLGIVPPNDSLGCLQDPHWSAGEWGYFPTYLLGALIAAQLFQAACREQTDILSSLSQGDFTPLRDWLRKNIHNQGCLYDTQTLLQKATGDSLNTQSFQDYLKRQYLPDLPE